ncbi:FecR family protein [Aquimarina sp. M1]
MKNPYSDETFLARWLNDGLDAQEKLEFEQSKDYHKYVTLISKIDSLESPDYDKENIFRSIKNKIDKQNKTIYLFTKWSYGIAATLLVLIGLFFFFNRSTIYTTGYGEQTTVELLDGSEVVLNSKSELSFKKSDWKDTRIVSLKGEAFFKVKKGSDFIVETTSGIAEVLGTQFNVNTQNDFFEVICHEGSVKAVGRDSKEAILVKGSAFRVTSNKAEQWQTNTTEPSWISGETTFNNTPLKQVIISLENQFNISFKKKNIDQNQRFTGSFNHHDIELALKTIFVPMEISYTFRNENHIVLVQK